jgi:hypothetical protein
VSPAGPATGDVLLVLVPLAVALLAMVHAMVRWSHALLDPRVGPRRGWGVAYAALWAVILALFVRLFHVLEGRVTARNLGALGLVAGAFWAVQALIVWLGRAMARAQARDAAAAARLPEPDEAGDAGEALEEPEAAPAAVPPPEAAARRSRLAAVGRVLRPAGMLASALVVIAIGEALPAMQALEVFMAEHRAVMLTATLGPAVLGWLLLMGGAIRMALGGGEPMSPRQVAEMHARLRRTPGAAGRAAHRVLGKALGKQAADEASFSEVKAAWRARAWRYSPRWRVLFAMGLGGLLMLVGGFGAVVVLATPGIKLLFGGALVYALVQLARGFGRA